MPIECYWSNLTIQNKRAFKLLKEINPGLIIPTHHQTPTLEYAIKNFQVWTVDEKPIRIRKNKIPTQTGFLFLGKLAPAYNSIYELKEWDK